MFRNDKGYWTQPFVDNFAGWSESTGLLVLADVTESSLIAKIPALSLDNDDLDGSGIQQTLMNFGWPILKMSLNSLSRLRVF